jgi:predicted HicB family RNase H-like nuclease
MTNINIELNPELHKQLKLKALQEGKYLKDYIIDKLEESL